MDWNRKKIWPAAAASLVAITSLLNAADDTQMRNLENRLSALEQRKGSNGMINPPARPVVKDGVDLCLQGDVILWQASENNLGYALKNDNGTIYANDSDMKNPHGEWDWGFKLAAGYNMPHDGWDLFLQWTRFYTDSDEAGVSAEPGGTIYPVFNNGGLPATNADLYTGLQSASGHWRLRLNVLDLEMGREFYVSKWLTLRPHAGLRSAWVQQKLRVNYYNGSIGSSPNPFAADQNVSVHMKNNYWGMGLRGGVDGNWGLGGGFSLFSDLAAAILLGHFNIDQNEYLTTVSPAANRLNFDNEFRAARVTLDMAMGIRYEHLFSDDRYGFMIQLGWEQHMFFNQNQLAKFAGNNSFAGGQTPTTRVTVDQGDLSTQGVTLSAKFDF